MGPLKPGKIDGNPESSHAVEDGVDCTLLQERLDLTPTERLLRHRAAFEFARRLREEAEEWRRAHTRRPDSGVGRGEG